jgi:hypothetical protein
VHALIEALIEGLGMAIPDSWRSCWIWLGIAIALFAAYILIWPK